MSNSNIKELNIKEMLSSGSQYIIPVYQRNYSWGEKEIEQLLVDIADYAKNSPQQNYYIGSLVVNKRENGDYEIIDGQQRFTTLIILACYMRKKEKLGDCEFGKINLGFESRKKSDLILTALFNGGIEKLDRAKVDNINNDIKNGYDIIEYNFSIIEDHLDYLLNNVKIMRIELPPKTDLNHYFEIINSRGEQLEKHEIVKAKLMSVFSSNKNINSSKYIKCINAIWEACSNMERYVPMGFDIKLREHIFGKKWNEFCCEDFDYIASYFDTEPDPKEVISLQSLIESKTSTKVIEKNNNYEDSRFGSVINFPNFLLHVLKVFINYNSKKYDKEKNDVPLDDKRLIETFEEYLLKGDLASPRENVKGFIFALLETRFLFDFYVIKREIKDSKEDWSLLKFEAKNNKFQPKNTFSDAVQQDSIKMLLAAMHVSTPTMIYKNWLNGVLYWLYWQTENVTGKNYLEFLETFAKALIFDNYLQKSPLDYYEIIYENEGSCQTRNLNKIDLKKLEYGNIQNNFVFNYLDYLLWKKDTTKYREFCFTFRSSVEHFYPQNPINDEPLKDKEALNSFGNLCLISHDKNSRLSNFMPVAKADYYKNTKIDSIKQKLMLDKADNWDSVAIAKHEKEMVSILNSALNENI